MANKKRPRKDGSEEGKAQTGAGQEEMSIETLIAAVLVIIGFAVGKSLNCLEVI